MTVSVKILESYVFANRSLFRQYPFPSPATGFELLGKWSDGSHRELCHAAGAKLSPARHPRLIVETL